MSDYSVKSGAAGAQHSDQEQAPVIRVSGLGHRYAELPVLSGVDLEVKPGELVSILGASGSGKSTLLRAIAGFVTPEAGSIELEGRLVCSDGEEHVSAGERRLGMMFQDYALFPFMSVAENVGYGIHGRPDQATRVTQLLELVGLNGYQDRHPNTLSGGQQQRVALVRALAPRPIALLLDEPFANLDGALRESVGHEVKGMLQRESTPGILVTHDRSEALGLADRVALFGPSTVSGEPGLIQIGTPDDVYARPATMEAARLTGATVFLDGHAYGDSADTAIGRVTLSVNAHGSVHLMVRPHQLSFTKKADGEATVHAHQFLGPGYRMYVKSPVGAFWLGSDHERPEPGARGALTVSGAAIPFK